MVMMMFAAAGGCGRNNQLRQKIIKSYRNYYSYSSLSNSSSCCDNYLRVRHPKTIKQQNRQRRSIISSTSRCFRPNNNNHFYLNEHQATIIVKTTGNTNNTILRYSDNNCNKQQRRQHSSNNNNKNNNNHITMDNDNERKNDFLRSSSSSNSITTTTTSTTNESSVVTPVRPPASSSSLIEKYLPISFQPYARLSRIDKPIGTMLLLWPCYWSTALAATHGNLPDISLLVLFGSGAFVMRSAGCIINDLWDQDIDKSVIRTSNRPIACGEISNKNAIAFLAAHLTVGLGILLSLPNQLYCFQWGVPSLLLVGIYPTMKRFFPYPQFVLGLTFNWGCFMGWAAVHGTMDYSIILPLYGSGITWTLVYDTIYGHQDKKDDTKLGLQSTAITFGESDEQQRIILNGLATLTWMQWFVVGTQADLATFYYVGATSAYGHLLWQIQTADFRNPSNLLARFKSNNTVGAILFASITAGQYFA